MTPQVPLFADGIVPKYRTGKEAILGQIAPMKRMTETGTGLTVDEPLHLESFLVATDPIRVE